jgi:hypothetical protein
MVKKVSPLHSLMLFDLDSEIFGIWSSDVDIWIFHLVFIQYIQY